MAMAAERAVEIISRAPSSVSSGRRNCTRRGVLEQAKMIVNNHNTEFNDGDAHASRFLRQTTDAGKLGFPPETSLTFT